MGNARTCLHVDSQTEYSRCPGYALYCVGPVRCGVFWAVKTESNHHRESVSNAIDAFEPIIKEETATELRDSQQSYPPVMLYICALQVAYLPKETRQSYPPASSRRCSFRLPFVSIDGARPGSSSFPLSWRSQKCIYSWFASKDASFFRHGIRQLPKRWKK